jgi:hypothetical protein
MYVNIGDGTAAGANVISGNGYNGIYLSNYAYDYDAYLYANIIGNTISFNKWDSEDNCAGINAYNNYGSYYTYTGLNIAGNDISNNFDDGIYLYVHAHYEDSNIMEA